MKIVRSFGNWMFGIGGTLTKQNEASGRRDDDNNNEKSGGVGHKIGEAKERIGLMEKKRQELYSKADSNRKDAFEFGKKAAKSTNPQSIANYKRKGIASLKKAKMYEQQVAKLEAMMTNFEIVCMETEGMSMTVEVVNGIKEMRIVMEEIQVKLDPDEIAEIMGEIQEIQAQHLEVTDILATPLDGGEFIDTVDLDDEFDNMIAQEIEAEQEYNAIKLLSSLDRINSRDNANSNFNQHTTREKEKDVGEKNDLEEEKEFDRLMAEMN